MDSDPKTTVDPQANPGSLSLSGARANASRPNILLITVDTLRPDRLSSYGYAGHATPQIDTLAAEGALFENAFADVSWTAPSMASVMTGTFATAHGFKSTDMDVLDDANITIAESLRAEGYSTSAIVGSFPVDPIYGLDQGFDHYDATYTVALLTGTGKPLERLPSERSSSWADRNQFNLKKMVNDSRREDHQVTTAAGEWLRANHTKPFFLWVHYFGPHTKPDRRRQGKEAVDFYIKQYDPDVRRTDLEIGILLDFLEELDIEEETLVVFHADHGESLREHGYWGHGMNLYEPTLHIPLIVKMPGRIPAGARVSSMVRNVDISATIYDLLGIQPQREIHGASLLPFFDSEQATDPAQRDRPMYIETYFPATRWLAKSVRLPNGSKKQIGLVRRGVRTADWKYIETTPEPVLGDTVETLDDVPPALLGKLHTRQLFDMRTDRAEKRNLVSTHPDVSKKMQSLLESFASTEKKAPNRSEVDLDEAARERLRSLGYGE